jgi:CheY-like chemotaxis protein
VLILIADRFEVMRSFLRMCLSEFRDSEVAVALDATAATSELAKRPYDLILLDTALDGGAASLCRAAKTARGAAGKPVVLAFGSSEGAPAALSDLEPAWSCYLARPFKASDLRHAIHGLLHLPSRGALLGAERRRAPRLAIPLRVRFGRRPPKDLIADDVSDLGAFLRADGDVELPSLGQPGIVALHFPHLERPIEVECRVVWVRARSAGEPSPRGFAIEFRPTASERQRLEEAFLSPMPPVGEPK